MIIAFISVYNTMQTDSTLYKYTEGSLVYGTIFSNFFLGIYVQVNPVKRWMAQKSAERQIDSEIWKFRARIGHQSTEHYNSTAIIQNLNNFIINLSQTTLGKITDSSALIINNSQITRHYQQKSTDNDTDIKIKPHIKESIQNNEENLRPLNIILFRNDFIVKDEENIVDNYFSPINPDEYIRFRLQPELEFQQLRLPGQNVNIYVLTILGLLLGAFTTLLSFLKLDIWIGFVTIIIGQVSQYKEFNSFDKKVERQNSTVDNIRSTLSWWMSLNRTGKNSRVQVEKLINQTEAIINEDQLKWISISQTQNITDKSTQDDKDKEDNSSNSNLDKKERKN